MEELRKNTQQKEGMSQRANSVAELLCIQYAMCLRVYVEDFARCWLDFH